MRAIFHFVLCLSQKGMVISMSELGFIFHSENCVQCHACQAACKSWRNLERGVDWRRVHNLWRGVYPDTSVLTLSVSCMHCAVPACVGACPAGAISKRPEDGLVLVDRALCTGCHICFDVCQFGAPQFGADGTMQKCDFCGDGALPGAVCVMACPTQALEQALMSAGQKVDEEKCVSELLPHRSIR